MSGKEKLKHSLFKPSKIFNKNNKNLQPRISEIAHKTNKTYLVDKPYDIEDKEISVNPIYRNTIKKMICINSIFRNDYCSTSATDFTITLNYTLKNVISMRLESFEIPHTWYLISEEQGNNYFWIDIDTGSGFAEYLIIIPEGNYNGADLSTTINNLISLAIGPGLIISEIISYSDKFIFYKDSTVLDFKLIFNKGMCNNCKEQKTFGWLLGYRESMYTNPSSVISEATLNTEIGFQSEGLFHQGKDRYFYIVVNDFNNNGNDFIISNFDKSILQKNILARIPIKDDKFFVLFNSVEEEDVQERNYFGPVDIEKIQIQLLDEYGNIINLNNMDISIYLELTMLY